jgi:hypothetical protein
MLRPVSMQVNGSGYDFRSLAKVTVAHTHSATAEFLDNAVVGDGLTDEGVGVRHSAAILGGHLRQVNEARSVYLEGVKSRNLPR